MKALVKLLKNAKEIEKNQIQREHELESLGQYTTPELKEEFIYKPFLFKIEDVIRVFVSMDGKDLILDFKDQSTYTIKNETDLYDILLIHF